MSLFLPSKNVKKKKDERSLICRFFGFFTSRSQTFTLEQILPRQIDLSLRTWVKMYRKEPGAFKNDEHSRECTMLHFGIYIHDHSWTWLNRPEYWFQSKGLASACLWTHRKVWRLSSCVLCAFFFHLFRVFFFELGFYLTAASTPCAQFTKSLTGMQLVAQRVDPSTLSKYKKRSIWERNQNLSNVKTQTHATVKRACRINFLNCLQRSSRENPPLAIGGSST